MKNKVRGRGQARSTTRQKGRFEFPTIHPVMGRVELGEGNVPREGGKLQGSQEGAKGSGVG